MPLRVSSMTHSKIMKDVANILFAGSIALIIIGTILGKGSWIIVGVVLLVIVSCFKYIRIN